MTSPRGVLAVGTDLGASVESALDSVEGIEIETVGDTDGALYRLAADTVDCVVAADEMVEGESAFASALAERSDVGVVTLSDPAVGSTGEGTLSASDGDLQTAITDAVDADEADYVTGTPFDKTTADDGDDDASPMAPLVLTIADEHVIDASGPPMPPLGHEPDDLTGSSISEYVHPDDHEILEYLLEDDGEDASGVVRFEHHDGDWRAVRVDRRPVAPDRTRFDVYRQDVSDLPAWFPRGEDAGEMLRVLYAHAPIHLYVKDEEGRHVWVSRYYSGDASDAIGKRDVDFGWGEFGEETHDADMAVIESGEPRLNEEEYVPMHDDWNLTSKVPWTDEDGAVRGLVGVTWRITKRKEYERRLERENERLERFASIVSHDLRNPINVAMGNLELARGSDDEEYLDRIERALERMDQVTADVLTMAREGEWVSETERVSLERATRQAWDMVATADATLDVEADVAFEGDPDRLHHLFENLFRNAVEHGGEDVTVTVGPLGEDGFYVADDGVGMPAEDAAFAFETGQSGSNGTGLGLGIVREVAEAHGWEVDVSESDEGGACFEVRGLATIE